MNDVEPSRPSAGWSPVMIGWQLPQPSPPPTGSVTWMTVSRIWCRRRAGSGVGAVVDALAVDCELAAPLAVEVAVEPEVEPGAEVEAGVGHDLDAQRARRAVGHGDRDASAAAAGGSTGRTTASGAMLDDRLDAAVGMFDGAGDASSRANPGAFDGQVEEQHVARAVGSLHQDRAPENSNDRALGDRDAALGRHVGGRRAHAVAHAPGVVAGRHPRVGAISVRSPSTSTHPMATPVWW